MEHTNDFLRGMFAAYIGCEVKTQYHTNGENYISCGVLCLENKLLVKFRRGCGVWAFHIKSLAMALTPLSEITDIDLIKILGWEHHKGIRIRQKQVSIEGVFASAFCTNSKGVELAKGLTSSLIFDCLPLRHTDYLRSKHYDLGYMHIPSLITAGLAIKKTI